MLLRPSFLAVLLVYGINIDIKLKFRTGLCMLITFDQKYPVITLLTPLSNLLVAVYFSRAVQYGRISASRDSIEQQDGLTNTECVYLSR